MAFLEQPVVVGDNVTFALQAKKSGVLWDITGGTVTLYLRNAAGTWLAAITASLVDPATGQAQYQVDNSAVTLSAAGTWRRQWKVTAGGVTLWSRQYEFEIYPGPTN